MAAPATEPQSCAPEPSRVDTSGKTPAPKHWRDGIIEKFGSARAGRIRRGLFCADRREALKQVPEIAGHIAGFIRSAGLSPSGALIAILPCNDLDASGRFYNRLGFARPDRERPAAGELYAVEREGRLSLCDRRGRGVAHAGPKPFGLYLYLEDVDAAAREFQQSPDDKPWEMYEFALSDPDETLVRVGWPIRLRARARTDAQR